jgi:nucleoside-diphosphate-sugar epimerase
MPPKNIFCADIRDPPPSFQPPNHLILDALDKEAIYSVVQKHGIRQIYCLTALLSATGEQNPLKTDQINMHALFNTLEAARELNLDKVFWPSSIAAFGDDTPK